MAPYCFTTLLFDEAIQKSRDAHIIKKIISTFFLPSIFPYFSLMCLYGGTNISVHSHLISLRRQNCQRDELVRVVRVRAFGICAVWIFEYTNSTSLLLTIGIQNKLFILGICVLNLLTINLIMNRSFLFLSKALLLILSFIWICK